MMSKSNSSGISDIRQLQAEKHRLQQQISEKEQQISNDVKELMTEVQPYLDLVQKIDTGAKIIRNGVAVLPLIFSKKKRRSLLFDVFVTPLVNTAIGNISSTSVVQNLLSKAMGFLAPKNNESAIENE